MISKLPAEWGDFSVDHWSVMIPILFFSTYFYIYRVTKNELDILKI